MHALKPYLIAGMLSCAGWAVQAANKPVNPIPDYVQAAVADSSRAEADVKRDVNRKPAAVLSFAGVKPGDNVGELIPGRGYYTTLLCKIVGAHGHVHTVTFNRVMPPGPPPAGLPPGGPPPMPAMPPPACDNITAETQAAGEFSLPPGLDVVWTSENYHDLHNAMMGAPDMGKFNKAVFDALKPGGVYIVEDHAAAAGAAASVTDTLHRIEPAFVKQEVTKAGFVLEAQSDLLKNADDPHTSRSHELEGKSDKFLYKFRKPKT